MESNTQELFLLEFLVNHVNIPSVQAMQDDVLQVKTCIEFRILNLSPIFICQDSFSDKCACLGDDAQVFRKGKSCLFALPSRLLSKPVCTFPVIMSVYKKLPPTILPDVMTIGCCNIDLRDMLNALLDECIEDCVAPCKAMKNNFRLTTSTGQCVGEVGAFIRFSRFGRKIVTQFQMPHNKKPYLFKGLEESPVFQCRLVPAVTEDLKNMMVHTCPPKEPDCAPGPAPKNCCDTGPTKKKKSKHGKSKGLSVLNKKLGYSNFNNGEKEQRACGCEK